MPNSAVVITHPEMGIYLGYCLGLGFWSLLDTVGQNTAVIFESEEQARLHVSTWDEMNDQNAYSYHPITSKNGHYATISELTAAGLSQMLGDMGIEELRNMPIMGTA